MFISSPFDSVDNNKQVKVEPEAIEYVRELYAPKEHEVFQLVPPDFEAIITEMYVSIGQPAVARGTCWDVYRQLLARFHALDNLHNIPQDLDAQWGYALTMARDDHANDNQLIPNLTPLRNGEDVIGPGGSYYMGGVNNGEGLSKVSVNDLRASLTWN